ncbi:MAG: hypothetical protein K6G53_09595 [Bacteroidales bacterium]|nr:hypothetical protein [Bacteroidales bacterium]
MEDGCPVIEISSSLQADAGQDEVTIKIVSENNEVANLLVQQGVIPLGDAYSGSNADFLTDWENCTSVQINGKVNPVATPWTTNSQSNIPYEVRKNVSKADGWEMAFCSLNNPETDKICYFALYNKWSGTLRVFHYLIDPTNYGQEISYQVKMGRQNTSNAAPFYNSMEYGVPASHKLGTSLYRFSNFVSNRNQTQSFMTWVIPYMEMANNLLDSWYCFDLDMTGYVPGGTQWRDVQDDVKLTIVPLIQNNQSISLRGTLTGNIAGSFENPQTIQHGGGNCMSGICSVLDWIGGKASSSLATGNHYASLMKNSTSTFATTMAPYKRWGGLACNVASGLLHFIGEQMAEPESYENIPGKIDLKMDATMNLSGTIENFSSTGQSIYNVALDAINSANGSEGHMGRGVWSLADDPVVYIDKDDLLADYDHFTILDRDGSYSNSDFADYGVRLVWFLDPTSVKVNINKDLFPDVEKVYLLTTCGVFPKRTAGYTSAYRSFLTLDNPSFSLNSNSSKSVVRLGPNSTPRIIAADKNAILLNSDDFDNPNNSTFVNQTGSDYRYYGQMVDVKDGSITYNSIIVDPQIYIVGNKNGIPKPSLPDLVVSVSLTFESQGNTYLYTKNFIPRIEIIDRNATLQKYDELKEYANSCANQEGLLGYVANDTSIKAFHHDGNALIAKTLRMLKLVAGE